MASYVSSLDLTLMIDQPPSGGGAPQWGDPIQFSSTGDGNANGSTIVSSDLGGDVDSDDDYVGYLVECIDAVNTANVGARKFVYACSEAVGVVTFITERWPAQTKDTDTFRLINTMADAPWFAEDTGGSAVQIQDADRNDETDDYWNGSAEQGGPYVEVVNADNVAETTLRLVTDFTQAGGIADATLGANTVIGDLYELQCCPEWQEQGFIECTFEDIPREQYQGTMFTPADAKGRRVASGQGTLLFRGPGSGNDGQPTEAYRIFSSPLDVVAGGDLTVDAAAATNSIPYDAGTAVVGRMYCTAEGDVFMCTDAGSPAVPSPTLRHAPVEDTTIVGLRTFIPPTDHLLNHHLYSKQYQRRRDHRADLWHRSSDLLRGRSEPVPTIQHRRRWLRLGADLQRRGRYSHSGMASKAPYGQPAQDRWRPDRRRRDRDVVPVFLM